VNALVLSGGSIKGAFQAGALSHVLTKFAPDLIVGTSVGSLNGGFLADRAGRTGRGPAGQRPSWKQIGEDLVEFWKARITGFSSIGRRRCWISLLISLIDGRFNGLLDTAHLRRLVRRTIRAENLRGSPARFYACAVSIDSGEAVYADSACGDIVDYIIASSALPLVMPATTIGSEPFWDGGIREVAPLKKAIDLGASRIVCVACDPKQIGRFALRRGRAPFGALAGRLMDMVTNEILNNDIELCLKINEDLDQVKEHVGRLAGKRKIELIVIRPEKTVELDLESFTSPQIAEAIETGRKVAERTL
jgi:NTE family protein